MGFKMGRLLDVAGTMRRLFSRQNWASQNKRRGRILAGGNTGGEVGGEGRERVRDGDGVLRLRLPQNPVPIPDLPAEPR